MLIYSGGDVSPFGPSQYKNTRRRSRKANRTKTSKRVGRRRRVVKRRVKKTKRRVKRKSGKKKKLSAKNINFLKRLGLRVRK